MHIDKKYYYERKYFNIPVVAIFNVLLGQFTFNRHLVPVRALWTSCTLTTDIETANMSSVSLVIWCGSLELQNSIIWASLSK